MPLRCPPLPYRLARVEDDLRGQMAAVRPSSNAAAYARPLASLTSLLPMAASC